MCVYAWGGAGGWGGGCAWRALSYVRAQTRTHANTLGARRTPHSCPLRRVEKGEGGLLTLKYNDANGQGDSVTVGKVMFATGRKPNSHNIGLEVRAWRRGERGGWVGVLGEGL